MNWYQAWLEKDPELDRGIVRFFAVIALISMVAVGGWGALNSSLILLDQVGVSVATRNVDMLAFANILWKIPVGLVFLGVGLSSLDVLNARFGWTATTGRWWRDHRPYWGKMVVYHRPTRHEHSHR